MYPLSLSLCVCIYIYIYTHTNTHTHIWKLVSQLCPPLCDPIDYSPPGFSVHENSPAKNTGVGWHFLLQGIFLTQEPNPGLLHCRLVLCQLSYQGSLVSKTCVLGSRNLVYYLGNLSSDFFFIRVRRQNKAE